MPKPLTKAKTTEDYNAEQRAALAKNPHCGTTHYNLAIGLIKQKKWDEAIKVLS